MWLTGGISKWSEATRCQVGNVPQYLWTSLQKTNLQLTVPFLNLVVSCVQWQNKEFYQNLSITNDANFYLPYIFKTTIPPHKHTHISLFIRIQLNERSADICWILSDKMIVSESIQLCLTIIQTLNIATFDNCIRYHTHLLLDFEGLKQVCLFWSTEDLLSMAYVCPSLTSFTLSSCTHSCSWLPAWLLPHHRTSVDLGIASEKNESTYYFSEVQNISVYSVPLRSLVGINQISTFTLLPHNKVSMRLMMKIAHEYRNRES